jgi:hypothetical protein
MMKHNAKRERWMAQFENLVILDAPTARGHIEWPSAVYFFNQRLTPAEAARAYIVARPRLTV